MRVSFRGAVWLTASAIVGVPGMALACACGCSVFDVGTSTLLPSGPGGTLFFEYDFLDQTQNWSGSGRAPAAHNDDKHIRTSFYQLGGQYMFNDSWGVMAECLTRTAISRQPTAARRKPSAIPRSAMRS